MQDVIPDIKAWLESGEDEIALATVVRTWGSAPRKAGAKMAISGSGRISGSVSGGCVEGAVVEAAQEVLRDGRARLLAFGVADETAWEVGLACGGQIEVFVEPLDRVRLSMLVEGLAQEQQGYALTVVRGPEALLGKGVTAFADGARYVTLDEPYAAQSIALAEEANSVGVAALDDEGTVFVDVFRPPSVLVIVGGVHTAVALAEMAQIVGYKVIVIDPRRAFGSAERFPSVDRLIQAWPEEAFKMVTLNSSTAVVLLTHDPKIDDPALKIVLAGEAFYVGALGSRKTHAQRLARLAAYGLSEQQLQRIHAPVGLDIGAQEPAEIALAIMAEMVATRHGAEGLR
jgi:xanthine dehydrogenase accessory factor